jgi:hypothetical protein
MMQNATAAGLLVEQSAQAMVAAGSVQADDDADNDDDDADGGDADGDEFGAEDEDDEEEYDALIEELLSEHPKVHSG